MNIDLCRLCAKKDEYSKDLTDESNKMILKLIQDLIDININCDEKLPTKLCLSCEDKMVSFQLFILECHKIQETFRSAQINVKLEEEIVKPIDDENFHKSSRTINEVQVKEEFTAEDILSAIQNDEATVEELEEDDFHDEYEDADDSDVAVSTLVELKKSSKKHMKNILNDEFSHFKVKNYVKLECHICGERIKNLNRFKTHYTKMHKTKPVLNCMCGFKIHSKNVLYKHMNEHKQECKNTKSYLLSVKANKPTYRSKNINDYVNFTCTHCRQEYSSWYSLKAHTESEHDMPPKIKCKCGIIIKSKSSLYKHINDHRNPNFLCCDKCTRVTKSLKALNKHKLLKHGDNLKTDLNCMTCNKVFKTQELLRSHEKSHIPIEERKVFDCEICGAKFTSRSSVTKHKSVVHDKVKSYVCDLCGFLCGTNGELKQHRAIHSDDKPFVCTKCSKPFKTYSNLKTHMDIHEDTSYQCYVCNRMLNSKRTLRKHLLVHEDKCRHICAYCNKAFKRKQTLKVHLHTHTGDKPLSCKWCDQRFAYASTLRSHRLKFHPEKLQNFFPYNSSQTYVHQCTDLEQEFAAVVTTEDTETSLKNLAAIKTTVET